MNKYTSIFSSYHTIYRLITTLGELKNFLAGICRLYKKSFHADKVVIISPIFNTRQYLKIRIEVKKQYVKKGGLSILTRIEKEILKQEKEIFVNRRLISPLFFSDTLGAIYIKRDSKMKDFTEDEKKWFASLCEEISLGLKIHNLYQEQQKLVINYIQSLSRLLTQFVPTSYMHTKAIFRLIKALGKEMKLSETEINSLEHASLLHDTGKIDIPFELLNKRRSLTDEEFKVIAKHPRKGVELIKNLEILKPAIPIILHHHERYDGKGYPSKLKKENIPIGARILAVLDTFDSMYFGRSYKDNHPLEQVENEIKKNKGKQFDPKVVDAFLKILKRKSIQVLLESYPKKNKTTCSL